MQRPKIVSRSWMMTLDYTDAYGEELWNLTPNLGDWSAVVHVQPGGKLYLTVLKGRSSEVDQSILVEGLKNLCEKLVERGIEPKIGIVASSKNAKLFSTAKKAGFKKTHTRYKNRKRPDTIVYEFRKR